MKENHVLIIRTDSYAGNFEREMCAHLTGHIGECEVGSGYVNEEIEKLFSDYIERRHDEYGCWRPVALGCDLPSGGSPNDVVIWLQKPLSEALIQIIKDRLESFSYGDDKITILSVEKMTIQTVETIKSEKL